MLFPCMLFPGLEHPTSLANSSLSLRSRLRFHFLQEAFLVSQMCPRMYFLSHYNFFRIHLYVPIDTSLSHSYKESSAAARTGYLVPCQSTFSTYQHLAHMTSINICGKKNRREGRREGGSRVGERGERRSHMTTVHVRLQKASPHYIIHNDIYANTQTLLVVESWRLLPCVVKNTSDCLCSPCPASTEGTSLAAVALSPQKLWSSELSLKEPPLPVSFSLAPLLGDVHPPNLPVVSQKSSKPHYFTIIFLPS